VALANRHQVLLLLSGGNARDELTPRLRQQVEQRAEVHYLPSRRWRDPRVLGTGFAVNRIVRRFGPDVVHLQEVNPVLSTGTLLSLSRSLPMVLTVHDPIGHSGTPRTHSWQFRLVLGLRRNATRMIVHGPRMRADLLALDPRLVGRVDVIPHGVLGQDDVGLHAAGHEPATFLFFGRVESYKGLGFLLDAADRLGSRGVPVKLVIAGTGDDLDNHRARIAASGGIELIDRFVDATAVPTLFRRCTAVVLPYIDATQSGVATIALANGRPTIASRVGDLPEVVVHERTGLLVPPRDAAALADAMERLVADAALREFLGAEAARHAGERLSWSRIAEQSTATYRKAIEARPVASGQRTAPRGASRPG
jgi:glycosyltransferase involved in cell wall biosynthesis